jgi:iron complex outermembrane receptor protein
MVYASAASGSRPPGLTTIGSTARQLAATPAEELISYEAGLKTDLFDRRLRTNLTGFYMDYKELATAVAGIECRNQPGAIATWFNVTTGTAAATAACAAFPGLADPIAWTQNNAIPAKVKGFEWEITAVPVEGLRIDWTGGYNKFEADVATPLPGSIWPGNHRQPEWNMHANVSYDFNVAGGLLTPRVDWNWQSQQDFDPLANTHAPEALFVIPAYSLWNAQLAYKMPEQDWSATLSVTNIEDKWYHYQVLRGAFATSTRVAAPREFMFSLRKNF